MLDVSNLRVSVRNKGSWLTILSDVSFSLARDETLAIVGESGSGKSMLALAIMRLLPPDSVRVEGRIAFEGRELLALTAVEMSRVRGAGIGIVFQEALGALNPVVRIGAQLTEALHRHRTFSASQARDAAVALLRDVGIPAPELRMASYPHQLSGGMRQRVMIAMALACGPRLVIADEPTTSLDLTIQSQILAVLRDLRAERQMSMIFVSHNLGAVAAVADRIAVMYAGEIVELGSAADILEHPRHPYTRALLASIPRVDRVRDLSVIGGVVPRFDALPAGCRFAPRCAFRAPPCAAPQILERVGPTDVARCCRVHEIDAPALA